LGAATPGFGALGFAALGFSGADTAGTATGGLVGSMTGSATGAGAGSGVAVGAGWVSTTLAGDADAGGSGDAGVAVIALSRKRLRTYAPSSSTSTTAASLAATGMPGLAFARRVEGASLERSSPSALRGSGVEARTRRDSGSGARCGKPRSRARLARCLPALRSLREPLLPERLAMWFSL
jgi:hypothetical protein